MSDPAADAELVTGIKAAYEGSADAWASGPTAIYRRFAEALVAVAPGALVGKTVLDLGAGTGVASDILTDIGAQPIAVDLAHAMLRHRRADRPPATVGDAQELPFGVGTFDAVVAAFCLNHLPDPVAGLAECRRVTRSGGILLASTFPSDANHPAKAIVERELERSGYRRPSWYRTFKQRVAQLTGNDATFAQAARDAGYGDVEVVAIEVQVGLDRPDLAVEWRLNMPHTLGFVAALDEASRADLHARAVAALSGDLPSAVAIRVLKAHVP